MKNKVYIETSVISYLTARRGDNLVATVRQLKTEEFWENKTKVDCFISTVVEDECSQGDLVAASKRLNAIDGMSLLPVNHEVELLATTYSQILKIPNSALADSLHIALSVVHKVDFLLTWNMKHIAGPYTRKLLLGHNRNYNLHIPILCTPEELLEVMP